MRSLAILILLAGTAQAQEVMDLHPHTDWMQIETYQRDPYSGIFNWAGVNCCNGEDCRKIVDPNDIEPIAGGYRVRQTGEVVDKMTTGISPDQLGISAASLTPNERSAAFSSHLAAREHRPSEPARPACDCPNGPATKRGFVIVLVRLSIFFVCASAALNALIV